MMLMDDRYPNNDYYELKYKCGNYEIVAKFCSLIDGETLTRNLRDFLAGCAWSDEQLNTILRLEDDFDTKEEEDEEEETHSLSELNFREDNND